jgi:hypothetical protein
MIKHIEKLKRCYEEEAQRRNSSMQFNKTFLKAHRIKRPVFNNSQGMIRLPTLIIGMTQMKA